MSRESIIRWIVERETLRLSLSEEIIGRDFSLIHIEACELFGTWETALLYAGFNERRPPSRTIDTISVKIKTQKPLESAQRVGTSRAITYRLGEDTSSEAVIKMIKKLCRGGYGLTEENNSIRDNRLYVAACEHFGTWENALVAAGLNLERLFTSRQPSECVREELIIELQKRKASGLSLILSEVSLEHRSLASSVRSVFGSWRRGLVAAQLLDQSELGRPLRYDRTRILEEIVLRRRDGKCLSRNVTELDDQSLVYASKLYFPSWRAAVTAALLWSEEQAPLE